MNEKDKELLKALGYYQYAVQPYEKWCRTVKAGDTTFELRIRTTNPEERDLYKGRYSAKARQQDGSMFGFETFFSDDIQELDEKMSKDLKK